MRLTVAESWQHGQRSHRAALAHVDRVARDSVTLDSRVEAMCAKGGQDPEEAREWLRSGRGVIFVSEDGEALHRIAPEELS